MEVKQNQKLCEEIADQAKLNAATRWYLFPLFVLLIFAGCAKKPADEVSATFQKYRTAVLNKDTEAAWATLDSRTTNFYSEVLQDALTVNRWGLLRLDFTHKFVVLRLRVEFPKQELQNMTAYDVFAVGITNDWLSKSSVEAMNGLQSVKINGNYATASLPEFPTEPGFYFIKEGAEWKLALWKNLELANASLANARMQNRQSEKDFITQMLREVSKNEVDERIWDGPLDSTELASDSSAANVPTAVLDRKTFSLTVPSGWAENTKDEMYEPDSFVFIAGPQSCFFQIIIGKKSAGASVDALVEHQTKEMKSRFTDATFVTIDKWSTFGGSGFEIEGKTAGILRSRLRVFGFENGDNVCLVSEFGSLNDLKIYAGDLDLIRQTFQLK